MFQLARRQFNVFLLDEAAEQFPVVHMSQRQTVNSLIFEACEASFRFPYG